MSKEKESGIPTHEKLAGLPFKTASQMKKKQFKIQEVIWTRFEEARFIHELSKRPEYKFWYEQFKLGLTCSYGRDEEELVKIFANETGGLQININEKNEHDVLVEVLVKAVSESFGSIYFRAKGILPEFNHADIDTNKINEKPVKNKKSSGKK